MNETMLKMVLDELMKVPYEIKNVLLVVNCQDIGGEVYAGSNIIWLPSEIDPRLLSYYEKSILFAEIVKKLEISIEDAINFLKREE